MIKKTIFTKIVPQLQYIYNAVVETLALFYILSRTFIYKPDFCNMKVTKVKLIIFRFYISTRIQPLITTSSDNFKVGP